MPEPGVEKFSTADDADPEEVYESGKTHRYVSQSAVALRCRVMPPPCVRNPYLKDSSELDRDPYDNHRSKCAGTDSISFVINQMQVLFYS